MPGTKGACVSGDITANLAQQRELYGQPLRVLADQAMTTLGLTQGRLAEVLGLSAPMLSQLLSGRRVKIGNPAVVRRLEVLLEVVDEAPALTAEEVAARVVAVREVQGTFMTGRTSDPERAAADHAAALAGLRGLASADDLADAAAALEARQPRLAALLREAAEPAGG